MTHDELKELAAAYVLDALDRDERRAFEIHLAGCAECAGDVRSLRRVTDGLAWAAPLRTPSPEVRDRVLTAVTGSAPTSGTTTSPSTRPMGLTMAAWLPLAAMLIVAVALAGYVLRLQSRVANLQS